MSLLAECNAVKPGYNGMSPYMIEEGIENVQLVSDEVVDTLRWSVVNRAVFKRGDEHVGLTYQSPATEYQDGGDFHYEFYAVEPYEVTVTKYRKVK